MQKAAIPCFADAGHAGRACAGCSPTSSSRRQQQGGGLPQLSLFRIAGAVLARRRRDRAGAAVARHAAGPRLPHRRVRLPDRLQPHPGRVVRAARRRAHAGHRRAARIGRTRPTSASTEALAVAARLGAERTYFTHICHDLGHAATCARCRPAWSWLMMAWCWRCDRIRASSARLAYASWTSFTFPTIRGRSRWVQPGARARQLRRRAPRPPQDSRSPAPRRQRARRHLGRHDLRSAPAARRPSRQGAAAADDQGAEARGDRRGRRPGRGDRALHAGAVALGAGDVRAHRAGRLAARVRGVGRREFSVRPRSHRQLLAAARRSARATASRPRRSIRSATRTSSSAARASGGWSAKGAWTKPARCSATSTFIDGTVVRGDQRGRTIGFPTANLCTDNELLPPHGVYATTATVGGDRVCRR